MKYSFFTPCVLFVVMLALGGCELTDVIDDDSLVFAEQTFSYSVSLEEGDNLDLSGINGTIRLERGGQNSQVIIRGTKKAGARTRARAQTELENLDVEYGRNSAGIFVETSQPSQTGSDRSFTVNYIVELPSNMKAYVHNDNGIVNVVGSGITPDITLANGAVEVSPSTGGGTLFVTNGNITADIASLGDATLEVTTVNGNIDLRIPESTSARLLANVTNGIVRVQDLTVVAELASETAFVGSMGQAEGTIELRSTNGNIDLHRLNN